MAATRKSAKRTARKKRGGAAKRSTAKKSAARKTASRRTAKSVRGGGKKTKRAAGLKRQAEKGLQAARGGIETVRQVGDRAWETLKSTTSQVVEGVKETLSREDEEPRNQYPYR
jgi:hypothetical protein